MVTDRSSDFEDTWGFLDRRMSDIGLLIGAKETVSKWEKQIIYCNTISGYCSSWCKIGDELSLFVSQWSHFGCWFWHFDCKTASIHQVIRLIVHVSLFVACWFAAIGAFPYK